MFRHALGILFIFFAIASFAQKDTSMLKPQQLSLALQQLLDKKGKDSVEVSVVIDNKEAPVNYRKFRTLDEYKSGNVLKIRVRQSELEEVLKELNPRFAGLSRKPNEELTTGSLDVTLNKLNYVHSRYPGINGDGVVISIKEQRFDTGDIDYKNRHINSGVAATGATTHASVMATIAAGAANTSPFAMGAAPASILTSSSFISLLPDPDSVYRNYNISIQNHSYGTAIESFYGSEAFAYDVSAVNNPTLLHVFSSGNSGDSSSATGVYAGIKGFGNLTGNFKQAKNILTVGAVDSFINIDVRSSKGPAYDGRVKPEVIAFGGDGSSGAAAIVSGTAALVQQAYMMRRGGLLAEAALVKAIIINSADDVGMPHIDYSSGFGNVNAWNAISTVEESRYLESSVSHEEIKTFPISVTEGISQLRVTIAWTDEPALPNAAKALVNDVDASLLLPASNESWLPWVLSINPHSDSLNKPAQRRLDTLNNVEQITIEDPPPGTYLLQIKGSRIMNTRQKVFAAIQLDKENSFVWTFPAKGDKIISGVSNVLRWQTDLTSTGKLEYSFDGAAWQTITADVSLGKGHHRWSSPDVMRKAILRMTVGGRSIVSDTFVMSRQTEMGVGFNCEDSVLLYWNALPLTTQYQLYQLGEKYLQPSLVVSDTFLVLKKARHPSLHYAVAPVVNGASGLKSFTINYTALGVGCYLMGFFVQEKNDVSVVLRAELGSLYNVASITLQKQSGNSFIDLYSENNPDELSILFEDSLLVQGIQYYRLQLGLTNDAVVYSEVVPVIHFTSLPVLIYPNPAQQGMPINILTNEPGRYFIEIFDMQGRKIKEYRLLNQEEQIPAFILSKGVYLIRIRSDEGKVGVQKVVVY